MDTDWRFSIVIFLLLPIYTMTNTITINIDDDTYDTIIWAFVDNQEITKQEGLEAIEKYIKIKINSEIENYIKREVMNNVSIPKI